MIKCSEIACVDQAGHERSTLLSCATHCYETAIKTLLAVKATFITFFTSFRCTCFSNTCSSSTDFSRLLTSDGDRPTSLGVIFRSAALQQSASALFSLLSEEERSLSRTMIVRWRDRYRTAVDDAGRLTMLNRLGMVTFWLTFVSFTYSIHVLLLPTLNVDLFTTAAFWFIFIQIAISWCLAARLRPSVVRAAIAPVDSRFLDGWYRCVTCQVYAPPRAHHCKVCGVCVLKHGGHCYFTGTCVGFANQRWFVSLTLYLTLGSGLSFLSIIVYMFDCFVLTHGQPWAYTFRDEFCTQLDNDVDGALLLVQLYVSFVVLLAGLYNLLFQIVLIIRGQTFYEFMTNIHRYRGTVTQNCRSVFGVAWWLTLVCPPFARRQAGDGVIWKKGVKYH